MNYAVSKQKIKRDKAMSEIDDKLLSGGITKERYGIEKKKIDAKYDFE